MTKPIADGALGQPIGWRNLHAVDPVAAVRLALEAGVAHHRAGRRAEAETAYRAVLKRVPRQPDALHLLGVLATEGGDPVRGAELIGRALAATPANADAHSNLGNALRASGELAAAMRSYRCAVRLQPAHAAAWVGLGLTLGDLGDHAQALASLARALAIDPVSFEARQGLARRHRAAGELAQAEAAYRSALTLRTTRDLTIELTALLLDLDRPDDAVTLLDDLEAIGPGDAAVIHARARCDDRLGDVANAVANFRRALALDPEAAPVWNDLGRALRAMGDWRGSERAFRRASTLDPGLIDARRNLALIASTASREIEPLQAILARPALAQADAMLAGFAVGKLLDDEGRYDEAFATFEAANAHARAIQAGQGRRFDGQALIRRVDRLIRARADPPAGGAACASELPVFIVGMPRSGTSLVEQIAASHSQVHGAGELRAIGRLATRLSGEVDGHEPLARSHIAELRRLGGDAVRVIDKMPDNGFFLEEIARLFPRARVIVCIRDSRDTCLSNFFQLYTSGNTFSYSLENCAQRQVATSRLLAHALGASPLRMLVVSYERLVRELEPQSRRIVDFLDLPWEPACLEFQNTSRIVKTASAWQVRQPLYAHALGRWRRYARHLADLDPILDEPSALAIAHRLDARGAAP